jgi:hypothetical protein
MKHIATRKGKVMVVVEICVLAADRREARAIDGAPAPI